MKGETFDAIHGIGKVTERATLASSEPIAVQIPFFDSPKIYCVYSIAFRVVERDDMKGGYRSPRELRISIFEFRTGIDFVTAYGLTFNMTL